MFKIDTRTKTDTNIDTKTNKVVSILDFFNRFSSDIKKTNTLNRIKKLELDIRLKDMEIENYAKKMEHDKKEAELNYRESIKKSSIIFTLLLYAMCASSIILTPMGFGLLDGIIEGIHNNVHLGKGTEKETINFVLTTALTIIIVVNGIMGFYFASIRNQINQFFYKLNALFFFITVSAIPVSIVGNCNTLYKIMKFTNKVYIDLPIVTLTCVILDLSVIAGLRLKHDKKYRNYQFREDLEEQESDKLTIWNMIKTFTIDFLKLHLMDSFYTKRKEIADKYREHNPSTKSHENNNLNSNKIYSISHDKSHENNNTDSNENDLISHDKPHENNNFNSNEKHSNFHNNSHEKISLENPVEVGAISSLEQYEKNRIFKQNNDNKSHDKSHENNNSNSDENNSTSHDSSHENNNLNQDENNSISHDSSHENNNLNQDKNNSISHDNSHENNNTNTRKKTINKKNTIDKILDYIDKNYRTGDKVNVKELKEKLKIGDYDWTANRKKLMKNGKLRVDKSDTFVA